MTGGGRRMWPARTNARLTEVTEWTYLVGGGLRAIRGNRRMCPADVGLSMGRWPANRGNRRMWPADVGLLMCRWPTIGGNRQMWPADIGLLMGGWPADVAGFHHHYSSLVRVWLLMGG